MRQTAEKALVDKSLHVLPTYLRWLHNFAPGFPVNGDQVCKEVALQSMNKYVLPSSVRAELVSTLYATYNRRMKGSNGTSHQISVLHDPAEFYETLLDLCRNVENRVSLASLYLGTGPMEEKLVAELSSRLSERGERLRVSLLIDANRGSRGKVNSRHMLLPLLREYPHCQVSLYHTPALRGPLRLALPSRYNELIGLQHMKLYLFDNTVLISGYVTPAERCQDYCFLQIPRILGVASQFNVVNITRANLSEDYFTNRQDRYIVIHDCPGLADFYSGLLERISSVSLRLGPSNSLTAVSVHPYVGLKSRYTNHARELLLGYYRQAIRVARRQQAPANADSWVFPLIELPPLGIHHDSQVTRHVLECAHPGSVLHLATGYFNLTRDYADTIVNFSHANYRLLMAHPTANGFYNARGLAGGIPSAYIGLANAFLRRVLKGDESQRVTMLEYKRPGWTYHAKGLWHTLRNQTTPHFTLIGSSNFGARSVSRDLETQAAIVTTNEAVRTSLDKEQRALYNYAVPFTPDRRPPFWVRSAIWFFRNYF